MIIWLNKVLSLRELKKDGPLSQSIYPHEQPYRSNPRSSHDKY
jgi:hypothetical protein